MSDGRSQAELDALYPLAERQWLTDGPNSGGVAGLFLYDGLVYWFRAEWTPEVDRQPMTPAAFLERYGSSERRGYQEAAAYFRGLAERVPNDSD